MDYSTGPVGGNILRLIFTIIYFLKACVISEYDITLFAIISQSVKQYSLRYIGDMVLFLMIFCYYFAPNNYYYLFKVRHKFLSRVLEVISVTL